MNMESSSWSFLLEEACALALQGRFDESLALLDGWSNRPTAAGVPSSVPLFEARVRIAREEQGDLADARRLLEALRQRRNGGDWRGDLALARLDLHEGRVTEAAALLKQALDGFRVQGEIHPDAAPPLARMLLNEVDGLERPRAGAAATPARTGSVSGREIV